MFALTETVRLNEDIKVVGSKTKTIAYNIATHLRSAERSVVLGVNFR